MKKRTLFLIYWISCLVLMLIFSTLATNFEDASAMYNILMYIAAAFLIATVVFILLWIKICPSCKEGKLSFSGMEDGTSFTTTGNVDAGKTTVKDKDGKVLRTYERTKSETYEVTPTYKVHTCNNCGYRKEKLKSARRS